MRILNRPLAFLCGLGFAFISVALGAICTAVAIPLFLIAMMFSSGRDGIAYGLVFLLWFAFFVLFLVLVRRVSRDSSLFRSKLFISGYLFQPILALALTTYSVQILVLLAGEYQDVEIYEQSRPESAILSFYLPSTHSKAYGGHSTLQVRVPGRAHRCEIDCIAILAETRISAIIQHYTPAVSAGGARHLRKSYRFSLTSSAECQEHVFQKNYKELDDCVDSSEVIYEDPKGMYVDVVEEKESGLIVSTSITSLYLRVSDANQTRDLAKFSSGFHESSLFFMFLRHPFFIDSGSGRDPSFVAFGRTQEESSEVVAPTVVLLEYLISGGNPSE